MQIASACEANPDCAALGLTEGLCCPDLRGTFLSCCEASAPPAPAVNPDALCKNNPG
ncbi:unnamed protein product [Discosporangium mesarthrocarpum]